MSENELAMDEVLFSLDLKDNGGVFAPRSLEELSAWIQQERVAWNWLQNVSNHNLRSVLDPFIAPLHKSFQTYTAAKQYEHSTDVNQIAAFKQQIEATKSHLQDVFLHKKMPHTTSPAGRRFAELRQRSPDEALAYLFVSLKDDRLPFASLEMASWRGLMQGMADFYGMPGDQSGAYRSVLESVDDLRLRAEQLIAEKREILNALHADVQRVTSEIKNTANMQEDGFDQFLAQSKQEHATSIEWGKGELAALQKLFREHMALRAPVSYWDARKEHHEKRTTIFGWVTGSFMAVITGGLIGGAYWVLENLSKENQPDPWRISVLVLGAVLGIWALRLIIRMLLSHIHLGTDAAERVTMVQTYLALLEGNNLPSDDDRRLILQALFRPATDGIVKDEGVPHPALDALTKLGGR